MGEHFNRFHLIRVDAEGNDQGEVWFYEGPDALGGYTTSRRATLSTALASLWKTPASTPALELVSWHCKHPNGMKGEPTALSTACPHTTELWRLGGWVRYRIVADSETL